MLAHIEDDLRIGAFAMATTITPENTELQQAWQDLQAVPSYVEREMIEDGDMLPARVCNRCDALTDEYRVQSGEVLCEKCIRELDCNLRMARS